MSRGGEAAKKKSIPEVGSGGRGGRQRERRKGQIKKSVRE